MTDKSMERARGRIAGQKGKLFGWRPLVAGDVAVIALQVLGDVRGRASTIGLKAVVAGRTPAAIESLGRRALETALRKRAVLADGDDLHVVYVDVLHEGDGEQDDPLRWPWQAMLLHVPERQLPAIAGLATDTVPTSG